MRPANRGFSRLVPIAALVALVLAAGAPPAVADDEYETDPPVVESVRVIYPDPTRDWIQPGETGTLRVVFTDAHPDLVEPVAYVNEPRLPDVGGGSSTYTGPELNTEPSPETLMTQDAGNGLVRITVDVGIAASPTTPYGTYWDLPDIPQYVTVQDAFGNRSDGRLPAVRVDDPAHPIAAKASVSVTPGPYAVLYSLPRPAGQVYAGDTVTTSIPADSTATQATLWSSWEGVGPKGPTATSLLAGRDLPLGRFAFVQRVTWPDGTVREREWEGTQGNGYGDPLQIDPVTVPYGHLALSAAPAVGKTATARWVKPTTPLPFDLGTPTFTWWVEGTRYQGATHLFVPGEKSYTLKVAFPRAPTTGYVVDATAFTSSGSVTPGTMPPPKVSLSTPVVGKAASVSVGAAAGAYASQVEWLLDGHRLSLDTVGPGGGNARYWVPASAVGHRLSARVFAWYLPSVGVKGSPVTTASQLVAPGTVPVSAPRVAGTARVGVKQTATQAGSLPAGARRMVQWLRAGRPIAGATRWSYTPTAADRGKQLSLRVSATAPGYRSRVLTSVPRTMAAGRLKVGVVSVRFIDFAPGLTITTDLSQWTAGTSFKVQWLRDGRVVKGATGTRHRLTKADVGHRVSYRVTASKAGYTSIVKVSPSFKVHR